MTFLTDLFFESNWGMDQSEVWEGKVEMQHMIMKIIKWVLLMQKVCGSKLGLLHIFG